MQRDKDGLAEGKQRTPQANYWDVRLDSDEGERKIWVAGALVCVWPRL